MLTCRPALGDSGVWGGRATDQSHWEKLALRGCGEGTFTEAFDSLKEKCAKNAL